MSNDLPGHTTASDAPWRDSPADSDTTPGTAEPDPAEVVGDDGAERDLSSPRLTEPLDIYHHDTVDERLAEEEPEAVLQRATDAPAAGELQAPERGGDDVIMGEGESDPDDGADQLGAEDAAIHIRDGAHRPA